ncbi:phosphodiester glycosidase family protein [Clostridium akagii]|uniref:phosphodiester glycosidase family protein n=1 Tax=Clostridium akagii TaxID=91623 RepID=UPI00068A1552|nr:phosphodiester glycosidase family protein [Clostridium akagii]
MSKSRDLIFTHFSYLYISSSINSYGGSAAFPGDFVISNSNVVYKDKDVGENDDFSVTAFTKSGKLIVGNHSINDLKKADVSEALCFRPPALIINNKLQINDDDAGIDGFQPRTAIGQTSDGTILFLVMDGRQTLVKSGATLKDAQDELLKHGAANATCLDGGFSSTLYYDGKVINNPHGWNGERYVATALLIESIAFFAVDRYYKLSLLDTKTTEIKILQRFITVGFLI